MRLVATACFALSLSLFTPAAFAKPAKKPTPKSGAKPKQTETTESADGADAKAPEQGEPTAKGDKAADKAADKPVKVPSWDVRAQKTAHLSLRGGSIIGGFSGGGLEGMYYMGSRLQVGAVVMTGSHDFKGELGSETGINIRAAEVSYVLAYAQARFFVSNSFFVNGGLGMRTFNSHFDIASTDGRDSVVLDTKARSVIAELGIGNVWTWQSGFTLGCEWVGYNYPISSSYTTSTETTGAPSTALDDFSKDAEDLAKFTAETGALMALVVNVGWAF